jgi:hypothetical protein
LYFTVPPQEHVAKQMPRFRPSGPCWPADARDALRRHVSLSGRATLVRDAAKASELWSPLYREWFPKGLEDPELALLRIEVTRAEYWDSPGMLGMVGKIFAGFAGEIREAEEPTEAMHGKVRF